MGNDNFYNDNRFWGSVESTYLDLYKDPKTKDYNNKIIFPLYSSINILNITAANNKNLVTDNKPEDVFRLISLQNALSGNLIYSEQYNPNNIFELNETTTANNKITVNVKKDVSIISIPSALFGSSIKKGSLEFGIYYSGSLVAKVQDTSLNGELKQVYPETQKVAGIVLYGHGIALLTGSWDLQHNLKWSSFGKTSNIQQNSSASFDINFNGVNQIPTITMLAHANKGELNHSNNPTYVNYDDREKNIFQNHYTSSNSYIEPSDIRIKNITKYPYENFSGSLEKQVYISKIGIYDENKNLIGVAKLAKPVRKSENRDFTFKLKLDM